MEAYPKCYLNEIVETQGKLFEFVADISPKIDVEDFIQKYMKSKTRSFIDRADAYVSNMTEKEIFEYFCKIDNFTLQTGNGLSGFMPNWIGQFYAFYQWQLNIPSSQIIERLPLDFMKASYFGLHDFDLDLAVRKVEQAEKWRNER